MYLISETHFMYQAGLEQPRDRAALAWVLRLKECDMVPVCVCTYNIYII